MIITNNYILRATEIRGCENLSYEITELLSARSKEINTTDNYARLSTNIRVRIKQFSSQIQQLETSQPSRLMYIPFFLYLFTIFSNTYVSVFYLQNNRGARKENERGRNPEEQTC